MNHELALKLLLGAIALGTFFSGVGVLWIGSLLAARLPLLEPTDIDTESDELERGA